MRYEAKILDFTARACRASDVTTAALPIGGSCSKLSPCMNVPNRSRCLLNYRYVLARKRKGDC